VFVNPEWPTLMLGNGPPPLSFRPPSLAVVPVIIGPVEAKPEERRRGR
jgi:hypothetical protein